MKHSSIPPDFREKEQTLLNIEEKNTKKKCLPNTIKDCTVKCENEKSAKGGGVS